MNIFYLDDNIEMCARYHCDKHVVKMILESAQILCTVLWMQDVAAPYRATHRHHPCVLWANESLPNWCWLRDLTGALNEEFKYRFNHQQNHKSYDIIKDLVAPPLQDQGLTPHPQALPEALKQADTILAYRHYYVLYKAHLARWTKRDIPAWFLEIQNNYRITFNE